MARLDGNVYVDPSYTAEITGTTHPITGEELEFGVNAFSGVVNGGTTTNIPVVGGTLFLKDVNHTNNSIYNDGTYDVYAVNLDSNYLYAMPKGDNQTITRDIAVYQEGGQIKHLTLLGRGTNDTLVGNLSFTAKNVSFTTANDTMGGGNEGNDVANLILGDISFNISDSTSTNSFYVQCGSIGNAETQCKVNGVISNVKWGGAFRGVRATTGQSVYADFNIAISGSSFSSNIEFGYPQTDIVWQGDAVMTVTATTASNFYAFERATSLQGEHTFTLNVAAAEAASQTGTIGNFNTVNVKNGATLSVTGFSNTPTLNLELGSKITAANLNTVEVINVIGELTEPDTVIISGLTVSSIDAAIFVGDYEYTPGKFPGYYEIVGGDLVLHNATSTVLLVNSNYTDGQPTDLGPKGYSTVAKAQAAVADKAKTTIMVYSGDSEVEPSEFSEAVVTKDFVTSFVGEDGYVISLGGQDLIVGDTAADVASTNVGVSYTNNINKVSFGNVTGTAKLAIDHAGDGEESQIGTLDLTGANVADAQISVSDSFIGDVKLADQEGFVGTVTIKNSTIANVYGAASGATNDLTGANQIQNVYAEGQGASIKLGTSVIDTYVAGYSQDGTAVETLTYDDSVTATTQIILGGNANVINKIDANVKGGGSELLKVGGTGDTIGDVDLTLAGGKFTNISMGEDATITGAINVTLAGGTVAQRSDGVFQGLIYGASVTNVLDGGSQGTSRTLNVEGNAKVDAVQNFDSLLVTGGTLNVAGGATNKSEVSESNFLTINGDILNRRGINAGVITADNLNNYGVLGTIRKLDDPNIVGLNLTGDLNNYDFVMTGAANVGGNFFNSGRITALGDITVGGTFVNAGDLFFRATSSEGVFTQNGGLNLNGVDLLNTGFISAGKLTGVKNLTTDKMYVTGGAVIDGNITINAGAEVAFTNKANQEIQNGLELSGSIYMSDTSRLVVSGELSTSGTKTITVNVGDLIGAQEIVRAEGGVNDWTIKLQGAESGMYKAVKDDLSVTIYSLGELFVNSAFSADGKCVVDGNKLVYGVNAFATVEEAVAAAKAGATIVIAGDKTGMDVNAANFDVELHDAVVGTVTAKDIYVTADSTVNTIAASTGLNISADSLLTVTETIPAGLDITIDASEGSGSRLVLDVDAEKVTLDASTVVVLCPEGKTYNALVLAGEGETVPAHAGDLYLISSDYAYFRKDQSAFVDGDTFDAATGDALFMGVNVFATRDEAEAAALANNGVLVLVGFNTSDGQKGSSAVTTAFEFADGGSSGLYGTDGSYFESTEDHTTMLLGMTSGMTVYGLNKAFNMSGDYNLIVKDSVFYGNNFYITGNTYGSVMNGDIHAEIIGSTIAGPSGTNNYSAYIGYGNFGTDEENPIDIDVKIKDSRLGVFRGINMSGSTATKINANINIEVIDSVIGGHFYVINTADWVANAGANIYQSTFTAGSVTVTMGGSSVTNTLRPGDSLTHGANALQVFNAPTTLHIVATDKSAITRADWVMEWDTLIIDADARLELGHNLQFTTAYRGEDAAGFDGHNNDIDNAGTPINIYVNMSGYEGGTHTVITAGEIYTDATMSSISVIGDNDLTGQCQLIVSGFRPVQSRYVVSRIAVFDKTDDMYVNAAYNDDISGTTVGGQELFYGGNAHSDFEKPLTYASEWGGTIVVTGGKYTAQDFNGNNVDFQNGTIETINMGDRKESTLKVGAKATFSSADGSGKSAMDVDGNAVLGDVANFTSVSVDKGADVTFGSISGSKLETTASTLIQASSLNLSDGSIVIDVNGYAGKPHTVISTDAEIAGFDASKVTIVGTDADKFGVTLSQDGTDLILTTSIKSDTYVNPDYTAATTGTILPDGTYLTFGFNAFATAAEAISNLGSKSNTVTLTGGTLTEDFHLNGANFAMLDGELNGIVYGTDDDDLDGMTITVEAGKIGGIDLTAGDGAYAVSDASITFGDAITVAGNVIGGGDTTFKVGAGNTVVGGGIENMKLLTVQTDSYLEAGFIELNGGTIYVTGSAIKSEGQTGNLHKIISTQAGISGASYAGDPGFSVYASGNDVYLLDLTRIYVDPTFTAAIDGTTAANGDLLSWGVNAFNDLNASYASVIKGSTLFISNWGTPGTQAGDIRPNVPTSFVVQGPTNFSVCFNNGQPATFDDDVTVVITNTSTPQGNTALFNGADGNKNVFNGNVYVTFNGTDRLNTNTSFKISKYSVFNGDLFQINIDGSNGLSISDDYWFLGNVAESDFRNLGLLELNITGVTTRNQAKWTGLFDGDPTLPAGLHVVTNIKDSVYVSSYPNQSIGLVSTGSNSRNVIYDVHLSGTTIDGNISGARTSLWNGVPGDSTVYEGTRTLYIDGGENLVNQAVMFHHIIIDANASLRVRNVNNDGGTRGVQFMHENSSGPNSIEVDVTNYNGEDKMLLATPAFTGAAFNLVLTGDTAGKFIMGMGATHGVYIITKNGDVIFNPNYTSSELNGTAVGNTFLHIDEDIPENSNAYAEYDAAKAAIDARPGKTLYITGAGEEEFFSLDGYAATITDGTYTNIYGTNDDEQVASVANVDIKITGGSYGNVIVAQEGKTVTGDANVLIAGGTFGIPGTPDVLDPETGEVTEYGEPATLATIDGSNSVVGGTSSIVIDRQDTMYADVVNFDNLTVNKRTVIDGSISVTNLTVDCNNTLTVNGNVALDTIHLASADYTGPSKIVITAEGMKDIYSSITVTADGDDRYYFDGEKNLWLVSDDPGNIYLDASFTEAIDGTQYNGDLLVYGVNAFSDISQALARTTSDYTLYVLGGDFNGTYDLTTIGKVNVQLDGGKIGGFVVGDGADGSQSTIRITASTSAVTVGSITGIEGSTVGYRVIANKDAAIGTMDGIQYFRFGAGQNVSVGGISYVEIAGATEGLYTAGDLVIDFAGYTAGAGVLLQTTDGIANYLVPNEFISGTTTAVSREVVGAQNNDAMLMPYYDETKKAVVAVERGAIATLDANSSTAQNGTIVGTGESATTQVYGYNLSNWNVNAGRYAITGGTLFADGGEQTAFYWFFTAAPINVNVTNLRTGGFVAGYNDDSAADQKFRDGDFTAIINASTITWFACIAGQGNQDAHQEMVVGNWNEEAQMYEDTAWNITITNGTHDTNDFRVARYANLSGGTVNVTIADYDLRGDLALFNRVYNGKTEGVDSQLKEVNVTLSNIQAPASKWLRVWGHQEDNATKLNLTITDSNFVGDTFAIGLFDNDLAGTWSGEGDVYVSGMTMTQGRFGGGRGRTDGGLDNIQGTRRLHITGGTNNIMLTREFNSIEIADGAMLTGNQIDMSEGEGFILRGEAGYEGDVKQYAVVGNTITGVAQDGAKFVDAEGNEIYGYKAVVGSTSVFIYKPTLDVYYSNEYTEATTGTLITDSDGKQNYLVFGDNAVISMKAAYASVNNRGGSDNATIQVMNALTRDLYTNGYKTVVNGGQITNVVGGTNYITTTTQVDSGETDPETGEPIMIDVTEVTPADPVASVDITINKGATVSNVIVASEYSQVSGDALITVADGVSISGTYDGGAEFVGQKSSLVFNGAASAQSIIGFDNVTVNANDVVTLSSVFTGEAITIDATSFSDFTKKVLVAEGGFGDTAAITVNVIGEGFGYMFLDEKTLVVTSDLVGNAYANTDWTEADVDGKFVGDMAMLWDQNAFNSFSKAAAAVGEGNTLYIEGGSSSEAITLTKSNDVIVSANTTGTVVGSITADGGSLTISNDFTATDLVGFSAIKFNAVDDITVSGGIELVEGGTITIDMTGYKQAETDAVVLTVDGGITNLENENIVLTGDGAGVFHAYYSNVDKSIHAMRVDNFYVDVNFGTAGEGIVDGATNAITGEALIWNVNAFYYLNNALGKMAPGQNLYISNRSGNNVNTGDRVANIYLSDSTVPVVINGYTTGDHRYTGDVWVTIENSTIATAAGSFLFGTVTDGEPWNHPNTYFGSATLNIVGSTVGGDTGAILVTGFSFNQYVGTEENPAMVTMNFKDTIIRDDILFIGDSPVGKAVTVDGQTYTAANVEINLENVVVPQDKWWRIQGGDQESEGTVTVNIKDSTIGGGDGSMRFALDDNWGTGWSGVPRSHSDFTFNLENTDIVGYLIAGRLDYGRDDAELTTYDGAKTLNLVGENTIRYTYFFREINLAAGASLIGRAIRMATDKAAISIDVTGYTGSSKVLIKTETSVTTSTDAETGKTTVTAVNGGITNITEEGITVIGMSEESPYDLVYGYDTRGVADGIAPVLYAVVLKGAVKDIYVNTAYSADTVTLGSDYNGDLLFFGENAFATLAEGTAATAVTGGDLFVTGGKITIADDAFAFGTSLTVDAAAQLTYKGSNVITVAGDLVNAGTFLISAKGFVNTETPQEDILVLSADSITVNGDGIFKSDNALYQVNIVDGKELHLVMKKLDVYLNTAWADQEAGAAVEIPGGTAIMGEDAFATVDDATKAVATKGSITILASDVSFEGKSAITCSVIATEGSIIRSAGVGSSAAGSLTIKSGATAVATNVRGTGTLTVDAGATVTGGLGMLEGAKVTFATGSVLDFDISGTTAGASAVVTNYSNLTGSPTFTVTMAAGQADGVYALATDAASFSSNATLQTSSATVGELVFGQTVTFDGIEYTLALDDNNTLCLTKKVYVAPITVTYVDSSWANYADGAVVTVLGGTAVIGYDAFATGDAAIAAVVSYGEVQVLGGEVFFTNAIDKTVTVSAGASLIGKEAITTPITVNGTIAFDTLYATADEAQISGLSNVSGTATYTLSGATAAGTYLLASDAAAFNSDVTFGLYTLKLGETVVVDESLAYLLTVNEGTLTLTVSEYVPPTPEPPVLAYVNSEWSNKQTGDTVTVGDKTATIGYDAFAALAPAIAAVTDDGAVNVVGGEISFADGYSKTITVDAGATIVGTADFNAAITVNGKFAFDIANATATKAQFGGFSFVGGTPSYSLTVVNPAVGTYLLASDAAGFTGAIAFNDLALVVGSEVTVGAYNYALSLTDGNLALAITEYVPPVVVPTQAYVNSEWSDKQAGDTVVVGTTTATIGYDAFATLAPAIAGVTDDGKINVVGGEISFADGYSKTITVDAGATVVGTADFTTAITINGTVAFDTAIATATAAQFGGFSNVSGTATYTLTDANPTAGTYLLAADAATFNSSVTFGAVTLTVGAAAVLVGNFEYALGITNNNELALTVSEYVPPTPTYSLVYVNSAWSDKQAGDTVVVGSTTATIGADAFASGDLGIANVTADGIVEVVGGEVFFTNTTAKAITIDAGATLVGKNTFGAAITINGTVAFDTQYASATEAQIGGFSFVSGNATYTLNAAAVAGTYLLASEAASFNSEVAFGEYTLTVGSDVTIGDFTYALGITNNNELALSVTEYIPPVIVPTLAYVNSEWSDKQAGDTVVVGTTTATIGYDAFAALAPAIAGVTDDGKINVVGGEISFADGYSKTITVDAGATVVGTADFTTSITINGTVVFDTQYATATAAQFGNFSNVAGSATYTLNAAAVKGTYLLASNAAMFNSDVAYGEYTLKVGAEAITIGELTYALGITENNELALVIADKPVPPTPELPTLAYVSSEWSDKQAGDIVSVGGTTAKIGYDAFAALAPAIAGVTDDGSIQVVDGEISFADGYSKTITVDAAATVIGKADFATPITINGTVAFDAQYMSATEAQFTSFSNVSGTATYTLNGSFTKGTYLLATGVDTFTSTVAYGSYPLVVGADPQTIGEFNYTLEVTGAGELALTVSELVNGPDNGWNNYVYNKKMNPPKNDKLDSFVVNTLVDGVEEVFLDEKFSVSIDGYHNFIQGAKAQTDADTADYSKIVLESGASLSFIATATAATKFSIYQLIEANGKTTLKKKQSTALKKDKTTGIFSIKTKNVLLEKGTYYIAADCTDKKAISDLYNVYVNDAASTYFSNGDTGWNNYVYDKKATPVENPEIKNFEVNTLGRDGNGKLIIEETNDVYFQLDNNTIESDLYTNWVGFGDAADYATFTLTSAASVKFALNAIGSLPASKFVVYSYDSTTKKLKARQTTTLKKASATEYGQTSKNLLLEAGTYYVSMQSTSAKKGGDAFYSVKLDDATTFFDDGDNGWNNYVYDKKATPAKNPEIDNFVKTDINAGTVEVKLDNETPDHVGIAGDWDNFVGFGDTADYAKIEVEGNSAKVSFSITSTDAAKFIIYTYDGNTKLKAVQTTKLKKAKGAQYYTADTKAITLSGEYFISVQSTNAKKGGAAWYNVEVNQNLSSGLNPETQSIASADLQDNLFVDQTVDTFADAVAFNTESQLIDDKQSWQSLSALA